jgi:AcrR family transcriptional regulator
MSSQEALSASPGRVEESSPPGRKLSPGPGLAPRQVAAHQLARIHKATIEIAAKQGYRALKVRDIVRQAEVSTRAYYEHFGGKEDCFLQTCDLIARRSSRRIIAAQVGETDWRERPRLVLEEFICGLEREPDAARLALVEAYVAGEASMEQVLHSRRVLEGMVLESFARSPDGVVVPPMIVEGMVAGIAAIAKARLLAGRVVELRDARDELVEWVLRYPDPVTAKLAELDRQSVWRDTTLLAAPVGAAGGEGSRAGGDRGLILDAVAALAATGGYAGLTVPRIRSAACVSRRKFDGHFDDVEDCYLAALELRMAGALAQAARAQTAASSNPGGVYRAIAALCEYIAADAFLTRVCLTGDFPPGPNGLRSRQRLIAAVAEQLSVSAPSAGHPAPLAAEASAAAVWAIFHHHVIRARSRRCQVAATISYLALAPLIGAEAAVAAIQAEQGPRA